VRASYFGLFPKPERHDSFEGLSIKSPLQKSSIEQIGIAKREPEEWTTGLIHTRNSRETMQFVATYQRALCRSDLMISALKEVKGAFN